MGNRQPVEAAVPRQHLSAAPIQPDQPQSDLHAAEAASMMSAARSIATVFDVVVPQFRPRFRPGLVPV